MKLPIRFSYSFVEPIKRHHVFVNFMICIVGVCIFCAILAGIKFNKSSMLISFSNVSIVKYLRDTTGFSGMLFTNLLSACVFAVIIMVSCYKKYTISIGIFFYAYYVYAQMLTLIAFVLEFGLINTLVIAFAMLLCSFAMMFLLLHLFLICLDIQREHNYFKLLLSSCMPILICIIILLVCENMVFFVLRNYIIVLVY